VSQRRKMRRSGRRKERPVAYAMPFQKGECNRGASCKFSQDEQVSFIGAAIHHSRVGTLDIFDLQ
jgi:hypothetical protein